jgi:hypothetical protein
VFLALRVLVRIYHADPARRHELAGAVSIRLLLAQVFANLFEALYTLRSVGPGFRAKFAGRETGFGEIPCFSFIALATPGYGDVAPAHPVTRAIAVVEAVTGWLHMAIPVARFASLPTDRSTKRPD